MKLVIDAGEIDVYMIIPTFTFLYDPEDKRIEIGAYLFNYFLTINLRK
jgi:hypothetical protein